MLRGMRKGLESERCPLYNGEEDASTYSIKMPRNKKVERTPPEQEMTDS
jgi:hypothetical protein